MIRLFQGSSGFGHSKLSIEIVSDGLDARIKHPAEYTSFPQSGQEGRWGI